LRDMAIIINAFMHDLATGLWFGAVLLLNDLLARLPQEPATVFWALEIAARLQLYAVGSFIVMILTGILRAVFYRYFGWTGEIAAKRRHLLAIKHAILGTAVLGGIFLQVRAYLLMQAI